MAKPFDYTGYTWSNLTSKSASKSRGGNKVYQIKAAMARAGVTMEDAVAALGPPPEGMKVSGYNPNLVRTDKELAKDLGMNIKKEEARLQGLEAEKNANALTNMTATPVQYADNAFIAKAPAMDPMFDPAQQKTAGIAELLKPTPTRSLQATYSTPTTESMAGSDAWRGDMRFTDNPAAAEAYNNVYAMNKTLIESGTITHEDLERWANNAAQDVMKAQNEVYQQNLGLAQSGIISHDQLQDWTAGATANQQTPEKPFASDPRAQAEYDAEIARLKATAASLNNPNHFSGDEMHRLATEAAKRKQQSPEMFDGLNDFLTGNPIGQALAPVLQAGVGITAGAAAGGGVAAHLGSGMPATPAPNPAGLLPDNYGNLNNAANAYGDSQEVTMPTNAAGFFGSASGNLAIPSSGSVGYTPIDVNTLGSGATQLPTVGLTGNLASAQESVNKLPENLGAAAVGGAGIPAAAAGGQMGTMTGDTTGAFGSGTNAPPPSGTDTTATGTNTGTGTAAPSGGTAWYQDPSWLAALASMGTTLGASWMQASGAKEAAAAQAKAAADALALQDSQFKAQQANIAPWIEAGTGALDSLKTFDADNPAFTFNNDDPSYAFRLSEGRKALENSYAARGGLLSGNAMKGITDYGQQAASQEYQNAFNRYQTTRGQKLNRLQSLAGVGQTAVQQANSAGQNYATNAGNAMMNAGNAQAQGIQGSNDAWSMGLMGAGNVLQGGLQSYYQNKQNEANNALMRSLLGR